MMKKIDLIEFSLVRVVTEQYAVLEENYNNKNEVGLGVSLKYGVNVGEKTITVLAETRLEIEGKPFLILEAGCVFAIEPKKWSSLYSEENNIFEAPKGFIQHLSVIVIGTCRGILHSKTEGTDYNKFFLPTINITELVKEDLRLPLD